MPEIHAFYLRKLYEDSKLTKVNEELSPNTKKLKEEILKKHTK